MLLLFFASDFVNRNIEHWFQTPLDKLLEDTKSVADTFTLNTEELAFHYAQQLSRTISAEKLINPENRPALREFIRGKLTEYKLDEIGIFLDDEELFSYINPNLPLQDYRDQSKNYNIDGSDNVDILDVTVYGGGTQSWGGQPFMSFDQEAVQELSVGRGGFSSDVGFGSIITSPWSKATSERESLSWSGCIPSA